MINIIIATHGPLAQALLASAEMVYGPLPAVRTVALTGESGIEGFKHEFARVVQSAAEDVDGILVLCDMQSGTPWNVACQYAFSAAMTPPVAVIGGVNLPVLLQSHDVSDFRDVHTAAAHLLEHTLPTLVVATAAPSAPSDDF